MKCNTVADCWGCICQDTAKLEADFKLDVTQYYTRIRSISDIVNIVLYLTQVCVNHFVIKAGKQRVKHRNDYKGTCLLFVFSISR